MKKTAVTILAAAVLLLSGQGLRAQNNIGEEDLFGDEIGLQDEMQDSTEVDGIPEGFELIDTLMYVPAIAVDTNLVGKSIVEELTRRGVGLRQSAEIAAALDTHIFYNSERAIYGYRVRIFFDNKQSSRRDSGTTVDRFKDTHPEVPVYWSYVNPYFKVTVGAYRTRSEAMQLLQGLKEDFPAAFIVRERINYPAIDKEHAMVLDSVQILRPIPGYEPPAEEPDPDEISDLL